MSQARPQAWWRQAHSDLDLEQLLRVLEQQGVDGEALADLPLRALTRMTVTSRYPLDDTPPMDLFDPADSAQAIATADAVLAWVEGHDRAG